MITPRLQITWLLITRQNDQVALSLHLLWCWFLFISHTLGHLLGAVLSLFWVFFQRRTSSPTVLHTHTLSHTLQHLPLLPPSPPQSQKQTACVLSSHPKFHDFPRIPIWSQLIYSVVIHDGALMRTLVEHGYTTTHHSLLKETRTPSMTHQTLLWTFIKIVSFNSSLCAKRTHAWLIKLITFKGESRLKPVHVAEWK